MDKTESMIEGIAQQRARRDEVPGTWPVKRRLAAALRDLLDCLCATDAADEELLAAARRIEASASLFAAQPRMQDPPGVAELSLAGGMEIFHDRSPVVGLANPLAAPVNLESDSETDTVRGTVTFGNAYEGAPGCVHGGFVAAALDEALGMACIFSGNPGMTGELTIRYCNPTPTKAPLRIDARLDRVEGRKIYTSGEMYAGDLLTAKATGLFISITRGRFGELREAQKRRLASADAE